MTTRPTSGGDRARLEQVEAGRVRRLIDGEREVASAAFALGLGSSEVAHERARHRARSAAPA